MKAATGAGIAVAGTGDWRAVGEEEESSRAGEGRRDGTQGKAAIAADIAVAGTGDRRAVGEEEESSRRGDICWNSNTRVE